MSIILPSENTTKSLLLFLSLKHEALSDSGFSPGVVHDFPNTMEIGISIKSKSISLLIKGLVHCKTGKALACQDKSIYMCAMLLGSLQSRVELLGAQLCWFFELPLL